MPKYWGNQIFARGRFLEVGQKQKAERGRKKREKRRDRTMVITMAKLRMAHAIFSHMFSFCHKCCHFVTSRQFKDSYNCI